jgi:hypothetical protein
MYNTEITAIRIAVVLKPDEPDGWGGLIMAAGSFRRMDGITRQFYHPREQTSLERFFRPPFSQAFGIWD